MAITGYGYYDRTWYPVLRQNMGMAGHGMPGYGSMGEDTVCLTMTEYGMTRNEYMHGARRQETAPHAGKRS